MPAFSSLPPRRWVLVLMAGAVGLQAACRADEPDASALYRRLRAACIEVVVDGRLAGSGWLAAEPGYAFTASHVVPRRQSAVAVRLGDGRRIAAAVRGRDAGHDALLLSLTDKRDLPAGLPLAAGLPRPGDEVFLFGAPIFRHGVLFPGRVAREGTTFEWIPDQREAVECVHVVASTPKGVSGGPWVNRQGEVVGVQSGLIEQGSGPAGIGWFGPASALVPMLASKRDDPTPTLGVAFEELDEQEVDAIRGFPAGASGVVVKLIAKGGPAEAAKLPACCLVVALDGEHPTTRDAAYRLVRSRPVGRKIVVRYLVAGKAAERSAQVVVGGWREEP